MLKKVFRVILPIVCTIGVIFTIGIIGLGGCMSEKQRHQYARERIQEISGIEVPTESKILFHYIDNAFVNGRAEQLTVFEFDNEPTNWLEENKFLRSDDKTLVDEDGDSLVADNEGYFLSYFDIKQIEKKEIPNEYVPNFKIPYLWVDRGINSDYFFYYPDTMRLIVYIAWS